MIELGTVKPGKTLRIPFSTFDKDDGSSITMTNFAVGDILIYKDGSTTERASTNGFTATTDFDSKTGKHILIIDLADNTTTDFFQAGSEYLVGIDAVTVDAVTVGGWVARFSIGYSGSILDTTIATLSSQTSFTLTTGPAEDDALNGLWAIIHDAASAVQLSWVLVSDYTGSTKTVTLAAGATFTVTAKDNISIMFPAPLQPTTAGRTLDVSATGEAGLDFDNIKQASGSTTLTNITVPIVTTLTNLPSIPNNWLTAAGINDGAFTAAKFASGAFDAVWSVATRSLTTFGTLVSDTAAAVWAVATSGLTSAGTIGKLLVDNINATISSRAAGSIFTGITSLAEWLGLIAGKQTANSTARTEIRATGAGSGTYDETTDSLEAVRDRGDAAWITATGFSTHSAADVWAVATRVLTAATNISGPIADQVWEEAIADHSGTSGSTAEALNAAGSAGDPWTTALPGSYSSGQAGHTVGTYLTGNAFTRLGSPAGASVSADIAAVKTDTGNLLSRITSALFSGITSLASWLGALAGKTADSSTQTEIRATTAGASYTITTDSLEALRDRGDAAWTTATGFSTHSASDVWAVATRTLTSAANITSTGGTITVSSGKVTVGTNDDKTGYSVSGTTTTLDALQTALNSTHGAGSWATATGFSTHSASDVWAVGTRVLTSATNISGPIADQVWEEAIADHSGTSGSTAEALNAAGSAGDPWTTALPGSYTAGQAGYIVGTNINATISSRSTLTQTQVTGGAYALNSASFAFNSALDLTTTQKASVNTEADTALADWHRETTSTVNDASAGVSSFVTALSSSVDNLYKDMLIRFTSGNCASQIRTIYSYNGTTKAIVVDEAFSQAPANGDAFEIRRDHVHSVLSIVTDVWASAARTLTAIDEDSTTLDLDATIQAALTAQGYTTTRAGYLNNINNANLASVPAFPSNFASLGINASGHVSRVVLVDTTTTNTDMITAAGIRSAVGLASANLDTQLDALPTAAENATAVLTTQMTESYRATNAAPTLAQASFEIIAHMGESSISGTTKTLKKIDGSTTAKTYTLDDATTPTSITETT